MHDRDHSPYLLGSTEHERRRLSLQGRILSPLTDRFLRQAGVSPRMRVLDLGCGIGDVSLLLARIVGPRGSVTGLDPDDAALETARMRADKDGLAQINFEHTSFEAYAPRCSYDAVVGRHVLIHAADPYAWIVKSKSLLRAHGIAAFVEYDLSYFPPMEPELPLFSELGEYLVELFRRAVAYPDAGARLYHWMQSAELSNIRSTGECLMSGGLESAYCEWFAETIRSAAPRLEALGIVGVPELGLETLADRLHEEVVACAGCLTTPLIVSCFGERSNSIADAG